MPVDDSASPSDAGNLFRTLGDQVSEMWPGQPVSGSPSSPAAAPADARVDPPEPDPAPELAEGLLENDGIGVDTKRIGGYNFVVYGTQLLVALGGEQVGAYDVSPAPLAQWVGLIDARGSVLPMVISRTVRGIGVTVGTAGPPDLPRLPAMY